MASKRFLYSSYYISILALLPVLLSFLATDIHCVRIKSVKIPSHYALEGDNDDNNDDDDKKEPLILDCIYEIDEHENSLVVKWFKDNQAIYQWIVGTDAKAYPQMRNRINESYVASYDDLWQRHRAVQFIDPSLDLSGDYKCLIQTAQTAASSMSHLEIIDMTNVTFDLDTIERDDDTLVNCSIDNIKPKPTLELRLNDDETIDIDNETLSEDSNGYFHVTVYGNVTNDKIDSGTKFGCLLSFEGTNFTKLYSEVHSGKRSYKFSTEYSLLSSVIVLILSTTLRDLI